jgi:glyoxylase-like metal-dependent hydrolase (beta-lactamase superfamily II)
MKTLSHIRHFTAANPGYMTLQGTNQYVLGRESVTVIDVALGSDANMDGILEQVEALGAKKIEKILLTHIHRDHCGGALALKKRCGAKIGLFHSRSGYLGGEDFHYAAGDRIEYDGGELSVVHTPGHESGHCCFYEARQEVLFTGDHILGEGTTVIPPPDGDMALYIQSLEKLLEFKIRLLLPGHGPVIEDPRGKIREYIDHRLMRERQVLGCLRKGIDTISAMTSEIYVDVPKPLWSVAEYSVEAHLIKLINEGWVGREGGRYFLIERE